MTQLNSKVRGYGSGSGESRHYCVEVRNTFNQPVVSPCGLILDNEWRQLPVSIRKDEKGIIPNYNFDPMADFLGLMSYRGATAMAHYFLAELNAKFIPGSGCVEARLVEVMVKYSYSTTEIGVGQIINRTDGEREQFKTREEVGIVPLSAKEAV